MRQSLIVLTITLLIFITGCSEQTPQDYETKPFTAERINYDFTKVYSINSEGLIVGLAERGGESSLAVYDVNNDSIAREIKLNQRIEQKCFITDSGLIAGVLRDKDTGRFVLFKAVPGSTEIQRTSISGADMLLEKKKFHLVGYSESYEGTVRPFVISEDGKIEKPAFHGKIKALADNGMYAAEPQKDAGDKIIFGKLGTEEIEEVSFPVYHFICDINEDGDIIASVFNQGRKGLAAVSKSGKTDFINSPTAVYGLFTGSGIVYDFFSDKTNNLTLACRTDGNTVELESLGNRSGKYYWNENLNAAIASFSGSGLIYWKPENSVVYQWRPEGCNDFQNILIDDTARSGNALITVYCDGKAPAFYAASADEISK
ncbi:hypothetical protein [Sedimentisphaera salicampi]|nr:hypothetical protein [Sedimentisphaera salicampi]